MSQKEMLIVLAHAWTCPACRGRLLTDPPAILRSRALTEAEKETLSHLTDKDFLTADLLARGSGTAADDLRAYTEHAVVRLRHF